MTKAEKDLGSDGENRMKTLLLLIGFYAHSTSIETVEFSSIEACEAARKPIEDKIKAASGWINVETSCISLQK